MHQQLEKQHIEVTPGVCGGRPRIAGTRIRVQDIVVWYEYQRLSPEEIVAEYPHLTLADVHAALAFYFDHRDQIRSQIEDGEQLVLQLRRQLGLGPLEAKQCN